MKALSLWVLMLHLQQACPIFYGGGGGGKCKTSTEVLNINFVESQTGVKGRKLRVSIQLTMRRWAVIGAHTSRHIERAVTSSSPPPLSTACHLSLTPVARVQAAQLQELQPLRSRTVGDPRRGERSPNDQKTTPPTQKKDFQKLFLSPEKSWSQYLADFVE